MSKQQRAELTRSRLVDAAARLFERRGFAGTNINDITDAAGVTKGALYFHFSAKEDLVGAVQAEVAQALEELAARAVRAVCSVQALIDLTHGLGRALVADPLVRAGFRVARECGEQGPPFDDCHRSWSEVVGVVAASGEAAGALGEGVAAADAAATVLAVTLGLEALSASGARAVPLSDSLTAVWRVVIPGIAEAGRVPALLPGGSAV
ncbi:ScbR family autoregulator-binding transcription factor [Actinokineospora bangkokensis]|uniref:HTH tetR-type domain-containing protein n=1 Tax=Actinokineospora bangkokensis TaxID=1193682 RepID=A0A1Q9LBX3_9PSEU|nr:ScbR family autoregulator-binding transcription factor [Actinokineospora bangkokensis]OLR89528.1 hypothetical protein BJP25_05460 [Actinokineospora bangkokensis]